MTFGLTREWWAFDDSPRRLPGGGPLLDPPRWHAALAEAGFQRAQILGPITGEDGPAGHALLLAQSDGFVAPASAVPPHVAAPESGDRATPPPRPAPPPAPGAADDAVRGIVRGVLAEALDLDPSGLEDDSELVALGLDFIGMVDVQERLERVVGPLPQAVLTGMSSVATLADAVAAAMAPERRGASGEAAGPVPAAAAPPPRAKTTLLGGAGGNGPASFWVPSFIGEAGWVRRLAELLGSDTPTHLLEPGDIGGDERSVPEIAAEMADAVLACARSAGQIVLGGYSYGGVLAFEIAAQLAARGVDTSQVILLDSFAPGSDVLRAALDVAEAPSLAAAVAGVLARGWGASDGIAAPPHDVPEQERIERLAAAIVSTCPGAPPAIEIVRLIGANLRAIRAFRRLLRDHAPDPAGRRLAVTLVRATVAPGEGADNASGLPVDLLAAAAFQAGGAADHGWSRWLDAPPEVLPVSTDHFGLGSAPVLDLVAQRVSGRTLPPDADPRRQMRLRRALEAVRRHTVAVLDVAPEAVKPEASLRELGANSIDRVEIATLAMEELNADVPRARLATVSNLAGLVELLAEYGSATR